MIPSLMINAFENEELDTEERHRSFQAALFFLMVINEALVSD